MFIEDENDNTLPGDEENIVEPDDNITDIVEGEVKSEAKLNEMIAGDEEAEPKQDIEVG